MILTFGPEKFNIVIGVAGMGLFTDRYYYIDEIVLLITTADIGFQPVHLVNHSCKPSCDLVGRTVLAKKGLVPMQEITIDYRQISFPVEKMDFKCLCGSEGCCGRITVPQK